MTKRQPRPDNAQQPRYYDGTRRDRERQYDPALDGWNVHKIRVEPTVDDLLAQRYALDLGLTEKL